MTRLAVPLLGLTILLAACGPAPDDSGDGGAIEHPEGDALVLSVESRGGFVPAEFHATSVPAFTLLGDGRVIVPGAQTMIFPGPALPPLQVRMLTEEGVQAILEAVAASNLFKDDLELRGAAAMIADAPDTVFTLDAGGRQVSVTVYGLGVLDPAASQQGISAAEQAAHRTLTSLNEHLTLLEEWLPTSAFADAGWQPYEPGALRLYVRNVDDEPADPNLPPQPPRTWPLDEEPAAFGEEDGFLLGTRCGVVEGEAAVTWLAELADANQLTRWTSGESVYSVLPRPLLPHEEPVCPELGGGA